MQELTNEAAERWQKVIADEVRWDKTNGFWYEGKVYDMPDSMHPDVIKCPLCAGGYLRRDNSCSVCRGLSNDERQGSDSRGI